MEMIAGLLPIVFWIVIFSLISGNAKKQRKQRMARRQMEAMRERAARPEPEQIAMTMEEAEPFFGEGEDPCHEHMLRPAKTRAQALTVSPEELAEAGEGDDPCHPAQPTAAETTREETMEAPNPWQSDLVRGVVMSEILTRPQERRAMQRARRGMR